MTRRIRTIFGIWLALSLIPVLGFASQQPDSDHSNATASLDKICASVDAKSPLEQQKLCVELAKSNTEREKLAFEESTKDGRDLWISLAQLAAGTVAVGIPVWTVVFSSKNDRKRRLEEQERESEARKDDATLQFQLKAAEIAMNARDGGEGKVKAEALEALFPERLPRGFAAKLDPSKVKFGPGREMRMELLKLLTEYPGSRGDLLRIWSILYPGDLDANWIPPKDGPYLWLPSLIKDPVGKNQEHSRSSKNPDPDESSSPHFSE